MTTPSTLAAELLTAVLVMLGEGPLVPAWALGIDGIAAWENGHFAGDALEFASAQLTAFTRLPCSMKGCKNGTSENVWAFCV